MNILLTGYTGFVGEHLLSALMKSKYKISLLGRGKPRNYDLSYSELDLARDTKIQDRLSGIDVVIHCAARSHVMNENIINPLDEYRKVNTFGTKNLAEQAAVAGVKRFIYLSSIKVHGESTSDEAAFKSTDKPQPTDDYSISKYEAEQALFNLIKESTMDVVIIRPPLIYGPGVKGNFKSLMTLTKKPLPLPFGSITNNKRSMISIYNLIDLIYVCIDHPEAANKAFLVSDDDDVSTKDLLMILREEQAGKSFIFSFSASLLNFIAKITRTKPIIDRMTQSLQVDMEDTKMILGWKPPLTFRESIKKTIGSGV